MASTKSIYIGNNENKPIRANIITVGLDNSIPRRIQAIYVGDENNKPHQVFRNELIVRSLISKVEQHTSSWGGYTTLFATTTDIKPGHRYLVKNYTNFWPSGYSEQFGLYDQYADGTFGFYYSRANGASGYVPGGSLKLGANMHRSASGNTSTIWTAPSDISSISWRNEMGWGGNASPNMNNFTGASNCSYFVDLTEIEEIQGQFSSASAAIAFIGTPSYIDGAWQWTLFS